MSSNNRNVVKLVDEILSRLGESSKKSLVSDLVDRGVVFTENFDIVKFRNELYDLTGDFADMVIESICQKITTEADAAVLKAEISSLEKVRLYSKIQ